MFDLVPDELQSSIRDSAREVAAAGTWEAVASSGLLGLGLSEDDGGVGTGCAEESLALIELGATLVDPTVVAAVLAGHALVANPALAELTGLSVEAVLSGETTLGLVDPWNWGFGGSRPTDFRVVLPAGAESVELATVVTEAGVGFVRLSDLKVAEGFDRSVRIARATGEVVGDLNADLLDRALVLKAALQVGLSRRVLDISVEYAKTRHQFGKPIGSFQAVKHHLAGMAVQLDASTGLVLQAAVLIDAGRSEAAVAHSASVSAGRGAVETVRTAIQVHGGIGVTDECELHLFLRRAHLLEQVLGAPDYHEEWLVAQAL